MYSVVQNTARCKKKLVKNTKWQRGSRDGKNCGKALILQAPAMDRTGQM